MTLTLPLVLAGALATAAEGLSPEAAGPSPAKPAAATKPGLFGQAFQLALSVASHSRRPFELFRLGEADGNVVTTSPGILQLQNHRTGVTCTMRILEVKPTVDAGIFSPASGPHPDPIVRNSLSPCVE